MPVMSEGKKNKRQLNSAQLVKLLKDNILKDIIDFDLTTQPHEAKSLSLDISKALFKLNWLLEELPNCTSPV